MRVSKIVDVQMLCSSRIKMIWKEITPELYQKIKPITGELWHSISRDFKNKKFIENIWIELEIENFKYVDPFYGEIESNSNFKMNIQFDGNHRDFQIQSIKDLENLEIKFPEGQLVGAFSNSLHFTVPVCKFGTFEKDRVDFKMKYVLTNSESYVMMSGSYDEHKTINGELKTNLLIKNLLVNVITPNGNLDEITKELNRQIYEIENVKLANGLNWTSYNYDIFEVPIKFNT